MYNYLPPNFLEKCHILMNFCSKCLGRSLKVLPSLWVTILGMVDCPRDHCTMVQFRGSDRANFEHFNFNFLNCLRVRWGGKDTAHSNLGHLGGDTAQHSKIFEKQRRGGTAHFNWGYLVRCSNYGGGTAQSSRAIGVGTLHNIARIKDWGGRLVERPACQFRQKTRLKSKVFSLERL